MLCDGVEQNLNENENNDGYNEEIEENLEKSDENNERKKKTRIGNKIYDEDTLNRITIVRLTQLGVKPTEINRMLKVSKSLLYKWVNNDQRV